MLSHRHDFCVNRRLSDHGGPSRTALASTSIATSCGPGAYASTILPREHGSAAAGTSLYATKPTWRWRVADGNSFLILCFEDRWRPVVRPRNDGKRVMSLFLTPTGRIGTPWEARQKYTREGLWSLSQDEGDRVAERSDRLQLGPRSSRLSPTKAEVDETGPISEAEKEASLASPVPCELLLPAATDLPEP